MRISLVTIALSGAQSFTLQAPEYFVDMIRAVWGPTRIKDLAVIKPLPGDPNCYVEYHNVESAQNALVRHFAQTDNPQRASARTQAIIELYQRVFPNGLKERIEAALRADAEALLAVRNAQRPKPTIPHESFLQFGLQPDQALALQGLGWRCLDEVPADVVEISRAQGIDAVLAVKIADRVKAAAADKAEALKAAQSTAAGFKVKKE